MAVNLLELSEIQEAINQIQLNDELPSLPFKLNGGQDLPDTFMFNQEGK